MYLKQQHKQMLKLQEHRINQKPLNKQIIKMIIVQLKPFAKLILVKV